MHKLLTGFLVVTVVGLRSVRAAGTEAPLDAAGPEERVEVTATKYQDDPDAIAHR